MSCARAWLLAACLAGLVAAAVCSMGAPEVVELTLHNFEEKTQASSGQTTGAWLVLFYNSSAVAQQELELWHAALQAVADDDSTQAIAARMDVAQAWGLAKRLRIGPGPSVILFRNRRLFRAAGINPTSSSELAAFANGGWESQAGEEVPEPASLLELAKNWGKQYAGLLEVEPTPLMYVGIAALVVGGCLFLGFFGIGLWYMFAPDTPRQAASKPAAPATAAPGADDGGGDSTAVAKGSTARRRKA